MELFEAINHVFTFIAEKASKAYTSAKDLTLSIFGYSNPKTPEIHKETPQKKTIIQSKPSVTSVTKEPIVIQVENTSYSMKKPLSEKFFTIDLSEYIQTDKNGNFHVNPHKKSPISSLGITGKKGHISIQDSYDPQGPEYRFSSIEYKNGMMTDMRNGYIANTKSLSQNAQRALQLLAKSNM